MTFFRYFCLCFFCFGVIVGRSFRWKFCSRSFKNCKRITSWKLRFCSSGKLTSFDSFFRFLILLINNLVYVLPLGIQCIIITKQHADSTRKLHGLIRVSRGLHTSGSTRTEHSNERSRHILYSHLTLGIRHFTRWNRQ